MKILASRIMLKIRRGREISASLVQEEAGLV